MIPKYEAGFRDFLLLCFYFPTSVRHIVFGTPPAFMHNEYLLIELKPSLPFYKKRVEIKKSIGLPYFGRYFKPFADYLGIRTGGVVTLRMTLDEFTSYALKDPDLKKDDWIRMRETGSEIEIEQASKLTQ
jgi:hypothetical protein